MLRTDEQRKVPHGRDRPLKIDSKKRFKDPKAKKPKPSRKVYAKLIQYELLERTPTKALLAVLENDQPIGFEVFKISLTNLHQIFRRFGTRQIDKEISKPDYCTYMNSQLFSENGWFFRKLTDAMKKYGMLK